VVSVVDNRFEKALPVSNSQDIEDEVRKFGQGFITYARESGIGNRDEDAKAGSEREQKGEFRPMAASRTMRKSALPPNGTEYLL
jgi:hypothetical protein